MASSKKARHIVEHQAVLPIRSRKDAGVDLSFFVAQAIGRRYSAVIGFANDADAKRAATLIKKVAGRK